MGTYTSALERADVFIGGPGRTQWPVGTQAAFIGKEDMRTSR
jgi:hypothetical protein